MDNQQIIIDGIDVSKCIEQGETISGITCGTGDKIRLADRYIYKYKLCKDNPNCLFKQLAYKTQECEELKKQLERKEANYQKLLNKSNKYIHNLVDENVKDISNLARQLNQLKSANEQAKQKLEKIREASKIDKDFCLKCNGDKEIDCIDCIEGGRALLAKEILKIIDEVER